MFAPKTISKLRSLSKEAENTGKLSSHSMKFIYENKLFKLFIPEESGGRMLPLPDAAKVFEEVSSIDGNLGWAVTIGSGGGYFYGYMQNDTAHQLFKHNKAVVAGSGHPSAIAIKVKDGYKVTGQWKYASGSPYATIFTANALIKTSNKILSFAFLPEQVNILKDWNAFGMKATESYSFKVDKAFVPHSMTFDISRQDLAYEAPIYKYPFLQFAEVSFAAVTIGLGRRFLEEAKVSLGNYSNAPEKLKFLKALLAQSEKSQRRATQNFYSLVESSWREVCKSGSLKKSQQEEISTVSKRTSRIILANSDKIIQYLGMQAIMQDSPINRVWRDLHTACQHSLLIPFYS